MFSDINVTVAGPPATVTFISENISYTTRYAAITPSQYNITVQHISKFSGKK